MELDTRELFRCLARHCNYHEEKLCTVSKADYIARDYIYIYMYIAFKAHRKPLEVSEVFWSFTCVYSNRNFYVRNLFSQKAEGEISNWDAIVNRETAIQVQAMFPAKKHPDHIHGWPEIQLR